MPLAKKPAEVLFPDELLQEVHRVFLAMDMYYFGPSCVRRVHPRAGKERLRRFFVSKEEATSVEFTTERSPITMHFYRLNWDLTYGPWTMQFFITHMEE